VSQKGNTRVARASDSLPRNLRGMSTGFFWVTALLVVPALTLRSPLLLSAATCCVGFAFAARDGARLRDGGVEPITLFAVSVGVIRLANTLAVQSISRDGLNSPYALYLREEYVFLALGIFFVGSITTVVAYRATIQAATGRLLIRLLPRVRARIATRQLLWCAAVVSGVGMGLHSLPQTRSLGSIGALLWLAPSLAAFTLARVGIDQHLKAATIEGLIIAIADAVRATLFAYLRSEILLPLFAFTVGAIIGRRSFSVLGKRYFLPVYIALAIFLAYFGLFGQMRAKIGTGSGRIVALARGVEGQRAEAQSASDSATPDLAVRLTTINQLTQIASIARDEGFLHGQTISYLAYAFVPRVLWPEKPSIAKGQWFASKVGMAFVRPDGTYSNSINMTVPGELYLNYGWAGVLVGCALFGVLLAALWSTAGFWNGATNVLGSAFGFYLLWTGFGLGADLQIAVSMVATYCIMAASGLAISLPRRARRGLHSAATSVAAPS